MIEMFIQSLKRQESYKKQIEYVKEIPPHKACYAELEQPLQEVIQHYLDQKGIRLYSHQANAINKVRRGKNVIIVTPTASGKTLAFNIPVFEALIKDDKATMLYLYPTKALTNDQLQVLNEMEEAIGISVFPNVYDGDTVVHKRPSIRKHSRIILSNPYGIHQYLPWHYKWKRFFQNLKIIVIDETHMYRGVFGSNVAMLIRRLLRICQHYGSDPQLILSSATIANPKEHSKKLTGEDFEVVANDGSARGKKFFIFWNPPFIDETYTIRRSTHQETKDLFVQNILNKFQTLCFTVSRKMAELITRWSKESLKATSPRLANAITAYRAGYLPGERRVIEKGLRTKNLLGVTSTNALELGIDIGSLDSVIISGYPGTVISTWQQAGRAGRTTADSLVTLVAFQNPLDQYFMKHPQDFFDRSQEHAIIDLENPYIVMEHLMCASAELPLTRKDRKYFSALFEESIAALEKQILIRNTPNGWVYSGRVRPVSIVNLNNISNKIVTVTCNGDIIETMDLTKAYNEAHQGAVLLHQGESYIVEALNLETSTVKVRQEDVNYYTEPRKTVEIEIKKLHEEKHVGIDIGIGEVEVTEFFQYFVLKTYDEVIGRSALNLPPLGFSTIGMWFTLPEAIRKEIENQSLDFEGGLHAIEHAMIAMTPFYAMCDRWDIGGVSTLIHFDTGRPTIFIYDGYEGGIGISEKLYELVEHVFETTLRLIKDCECKEGCPSCIYSPKCGNENEPLDKKAAIIILDRVQKRIQNKKS
ncbi:MAG: DEAD/DEAH box helicase [Candidatus Bathyarchaeota archaeon]|nr:MAG: DEAD/DEAH box helicase [Candidatus Bathyarchaeota archaeon]